MRARYSRVSRAKWLDAKFRALSRDAKIIWDLLLTCPYGSSIPGLIPAGLSTLAELAGFTFEEAERAMDELTRAGMAICDRSALLVWLPNGPEHNPPENPNVVKGWIKQWANLPDSPLLKDAREALLSVIADAELRESFASRTSLDRRVLEPFRDGLDTQLKSVDTPSPSPSPYKEREEPCASRDLSPPQSEPALALVHPIAQPLPERLRELWNEVCHPAGLKRVDSINDERRKKIVARSKGRDLAWWRAFFDRIARTRGGFRPTFDFAIKNETNVSKILEGHYDEPWSSRSPASRRDEPQRPRGIDYSKGDGL